MIDHHHGREHAGVVTVFTYIRRLRMPRILAYRVRSVVAIDAIAGDSRVVEERRQPASSGMAVVTGIAAGNMRRRLADSNYTVVTGITGSHYLGVIHCHHGGKHVRCVTVLADIRCLNVCRILANRVRAIVTAGAVTGDIHVIEIRRQPADRTVTVVAGVTARNMRRMFANCGDAIVAGVACTDHL